MKIAVLLENIYLLETGGSTRTILLFEAEDSVVTALDRDIVSIADTNYLCLWLLGKNVVRIYCDGLDTTGKEYLEKTGIEVYPLDAIRDHPMLRALLLRDMPDGTDEGS